ncbi:hypothetical protein J4219_08405 [Candidatus Woesearchaeota archaeon]|nr:hypothetical protein [Candidatus Woesearchaeota archaeon]
MKLWPIIPAVLIILVVFIVKHFIAVNEFTDQCVERTEEQKQFILALKEKDAALCTTFEGIMQQRCSAYIANEPALCAPADLDCTAIASKNISLCVEPICKALASSDASYCQELSDPTYCTNLATFNAEAFVPNKESCKNAANIPWI